jgi:hypothetical protein
MAVGGKEKYTKEQRRKSKFIQDSYEEKGVSPTKAEHIAWATVNIHSGGSELDGSGAAIPEWEKAIARRDSTRNAVKAKQAQAEPDALEHQPLDVLRKRARKKHISGSASMTQFELIHALRSG